MSDPNPNSSEPLNIPQGEYLVAADERGWTYVFEAPASTDFIASDSTSMEEYQRARREGRRIVTLDPSTGAIKTQMGAFARQHPELLGQLKPLAAALNRGTK